MLWNTYFVRISLNCFQCTNCLLCQNQRIDLAATKNNSHSKNVHEKEEFINDENLFSLIIV